MPVANSTWPARDINFRREKDINRTSSKWDEGSNFGFIKLKSEPIVVSSVFYRSKQVHIYEKGSAFLHAADAMPVFINVGPGAH